MRTGAHAYIDRSFVFRTDFGWVGLGYNESGLCRVELSLADPDEVRARLAARLGGAAAMERPGSDTPLEELPDKLTSYFAGERVDFDEPVGLSGLTAFQKLVLAKTREIPYGEVRSYAGVARQIGNPHSYRAVGQALGANPVAIVIPCHRVITSQGTLGGFGWGLDVKRRLLSLEGRAVS